jgi:small subunit ribosomal protein S19
MSRRLPLFISYSLMKKITKAKITKEKIKTWARSTTIIPDMIGLIFAVHDGRKFKEIFITEEKVGYKLGEFVPTRLFKAHAKAKGIKGKGKAKGAK